MWESQKKLKIHYLLLSLKLNQTKADSFLSCSHKKKALKSVQINIIKFDFTL